MKMNVSQQLFSSIFLLIAFSCVFSKQQSRGQEDAISILAIDSLEFLNYYACEFERRNNPGGIILLDRSRVDIDSLTSILAREMYFDDLCDVIEFKANNDEITLRGNAANGRLYEEGSLIIDLGNEAEKRYYRLCFKELEKRKF